MAKQPTKAKLDLKTLNPYAAIVDLDEAIALANKEVEGTHILTFAEYRKVAAGLTKLMFTLGSRGIRL